MRSMLLSSAVFNVLARPQFIAHCKGKRSLAIRICEMLGCARVAWTIRPEDDAAAIEKANDAVIFEHYLPLPRYRKAEDK